VDNRRTGTAGAARRSGSRARGDTVGALLAGGLGRRIGGGKAVVALDRRPLISYPLEAVWRALGNVAIVAKPDTELPNLPGATVWIEPAEPHHPLTGLVHALGLAEGRPVVVCAADMPFVTPELIRGLAGADPAGRPAVVAADRAELQPLLGCFQPTALASLAEAAQDPGVRVQDAVAGLQPQRYEVDDPELLFNVNTPDDLLQAAAMLDRRRAANRR
jgi:molybdopterin-guanine dinucleotide biosynthesis protein A